MLSVLIKNQIFFLKNPALYSSVQPARMWCSFTLRDDTVSESLRVHEATRKQHIVNARQGRGGVSEKPRPQEALVSQLGFLRGL